MRLAFEYRNFDELIAYLDQIPGSIRIQLRNLVEEQTKLLMQAVKGRMASLFQPKTGRMQESLSYTIESPGLDEITGTVTSSGLPYLKLQEFGGTVQLPDIFPVRASALHFFAPGRLGFGSGPTEKGEVFATKVRAHPVTLPERSFMRAALAQQKSSIIAAFQEAFGAS